MAKTAVLLGLDNAAFRARLNDLNTIAQSLGGAVEFKLVDMSLPMDEVARQSQGAIALHPGGYRLLARDQFTELVRKVPSVKLVQTPSAGTDAYDKHALASIGVKVANHGGANAVAVAEHAIALIVAVYRKLDRQIADVKALAWSDRILAQPEGEFHTLVGKRVGIVGLGRIGSRVAKRLQGWECEVVYHDIKDFTREYDLSSLRLCVSAGEALPAPIWESWKQRTGLEIVDGIGSTEVWHIFISNRPDDIRPGSSGKPVEGYEVKIVDEAGDPMPRGEVGNLLVKGETVALSYLHQYERSKKTFLGEWLFTGDKYSVDEDGYYWHAGRSDDMLKVGGIWVSPVEVESTLISHEAVVECAVVARIDESGLVKPKAYVVLKQSVAGSDELARQLIDYCRANMADYKRPRPVPAPQAVILQTSTA